MKKEKEKMKEREREISSSEILYKEIIIELINLFRLFTRAFHFYHVWNASDEAVHARTRTHAHALRIAKST